MPIQFLCPTCRKHYTVADHFGGKTVQCEACHQLMAVPAAPALSPSVAPLGLGPSPALGASQPLAAAPKSGGLSKAAWISIGAALLLIVMIVSIVILLTRKSGERDRQIAQNVEPSAAERSKSQTAQSTTNSGQSSANSTGPSSDKSRAEPTNARTADASAKSASNKTPAASTNNSGQTAAVKQPGTSAESPSNWLKPFVPKTDDTPAGAARRDRPAANPTPSIWNVKPDPAPQQITSGEMKWAEVDVPVLENGHGMVHPVRPSPFVALYGEERGMRFIGSIDLRDGQKKGPFAAETRSREQMKISFNGRYMAWAEKNPPGVQVYSLDDKKPAQRINLGDKAELKWFDFVDGANLIAYTTEFGNKDPRAEMYSIASGESVRRFELPAEAERHQLGAATISPGGAYAALAIRNSLYIFETGDGKLVGELTLPALSDRDSGGVHAGWVGLAFSWDGKELAGALNSLGTSYFVVWAVDTGKVAANVEVTQDFDAFSRDTAPRLEWFGTDGLLVDRKQLFHRDSLRRPVEQFVGRTGFRRILNWNKSVAIDSGKRARGLALVSLKLPGEELVKRATTLKAGGELADAGLPELTTADYSTMLQVNLSAPSDGWKVRVERLRPPSGLQSPIQLSLAAGEQFEKALISDSDAIVLREGNGKRFLNSYKLSSGHSGSRIETSPQADLVAVSPHGKFALLLTSDRSKRLDIINLQDRKHVAGWKPYADFPGEKDSAWHLDRAMFVDDNHVITVRKMSELVVWKVPECKAELIVSDAWMLRIPGDGRYFVAGNQKEQTWVIHETLTGKPCGRIPFSQALDLVDDVAFDPEGKRMAMLRHHSSYTHVAMVDLTSGERSGELMLPPPAKHGQPSIRWLGQKHLLIDNHLLADVDRGAYILNYSYDREPTFGPAGNAWIPALLGGGSLVNVEMPSKKALEHAAKVETPKPSLTKGGRISLSGTINVPGVNQDAFLKTVYDTLVSRGFVVDAQAPIRLHIEANEKGTGQTMQLRTFQQVQGRSEFSIAGLEIPVKAVLSMPGGAQYTVYQTRYTNQSMFVRLKQDQNPEQYLQDEMRESFTRSASTIAPPLYAFDASAEASAPRSVFQNGEEKLMPPGMLEAQATTQ
jgi:hypothetical protein